MNVARPILRYHGGKWKLASWIIDNFPPHRTYTEPFGGAASVLLRKPRSYAEVYNDLDSEIVNIFKVARDRGTELIEKLKMTAYARQEYTESFGVSDDPLEQARRTVVRSFMGFGSNSLNRAIKSGFRSNSNRSGTTPAHDWVNYPEALRAIVDRLKGVVIENRPADKILECHDREDTLHYCDPPYPHSTRSVEVAHGHHGYAHEMSDDEHRKLAMVLHGLKGMVVLSGYACDLYDKELYTGWERRECAALRDGALPSTEVLWLNRRASESVGGRLF